MSNTTHWHILHRRRNNPWMTDRSRVSFRIDVEFDIHQLCHPAVPRRIKIRSDKCPHSRVSLLTIRGILINFSVAHDERVLLRRTPNRDVHLNLLLQYGAFLLILSVHIHARLEHVEGRAFVIGKLPKRAAQVQVQIPPESDACVDGAARQDVREKHRLRQMVPHVGCGWWCTTRMLMHIIFMYSHMAQTS